MHAIDGLGGMHVLMQRLQHQAVAAERDHHIRIRWGMITVGRNQLRQGLLRFCAGARDKGNPVIWLGCGHEIVRRPVGGWSSIRPWRCLSRRPPKTRLKFAAELDYICLDASKSSH